METHIKPERKTTTVLIGKETHTKARRYCDKHGIKLKWWVEKLILDRLEHIYILNKASKDNNNSNTSSTAEERATPAKKKRAVGLAHAISFNYATNTLSGLTETMIEQWRHAYPAVDVMSEINKACAWMASNPANRKKLVSRFLNSWLSKAQDRSRYPAAPAKTSIDSLLEEL